MKYSGYTSALDLVTKVKHMCECILSEQEEEMATQPVREDVALPDAEADAQGLSVEDTYDHPPVLLHQSSAALRRGARGKSTEINSKMDTWEVVVNDETKRYRVRIATVDHGNSENFKSAVKKRKYYYVVNADGTDGPCMKSKSQTIEYFRTGKSRRVLKGSNKKGYATKQKAETAGILMVLADPSTTANQAWIDAKQAADRAAIAKEAAEKAVAEAKLAEVTAIAAKEAALAASGTNHVSIGTESGRVVVNVKHSPPLPIPLV